MWDPEDYPLEFITWARNYKDINRSLSPNKAAYQVSYVHGHDSNNKNNETHVFCLDNAFGKKDNSEGEQCVLMQQNTFLTDKEIAQAKQLATQKAVAEKEAAESESAFLEHLDEKKVDQLYEQIKKEIKAYKPSSIHGNKVKEDLVKELQSILNEEKPNKQKLKRIYIRLACGGKEILSEYKNKSIFNFLHQQFFGSKGEQVSNKIFKAYKKAYKKVLGTVKNPNAQELRSQNQEQLTSKPTTPEI